MKKVTIHAMHEKDLEELLAEGKAEMHTCYKCGDPIKDKNDIAGLIVITHKLHAICKKHSAFVWEKAGKLE